MKYLPIREKADVCELERRFANACDQIFALMRSGNTRRSPKQVPAHHVLPSLEAAKREVEVTPLSRYSHGRMAREGLQLGFAAVDAKEIRRGVRELAIALESELRTFHRSGRRAPLR